MTRLKRFIGLFLPALMLVTIMAGTAPAALLDFGPIVPEVVGSTPPNIGSGFPAWFRDTNRVPLQLCLEEVPGCLFAAVDRPNLGQPLAFPNIPDELFYYSATALIGDQLLFAGVEMNFADNGDGTYDQVGFSRVRIRISTTIAGNYTVTTPWKQYFFTVDQATIDANAGLRVINATEDIGLRPDGEFAGILLGNVGPYGYSQGAPFGTAPNLFLGDNTPRPLLGTPNNIFRIEGPPGFTTVETNLFAVTGKLYSDPIPTALTVDKATYSLDSRGMQTSVFATTQALSNQTNPAATFPLNFALTGIPSALQATGADIPLQNLQTNNPADGKFYSATGLFTAPATLPTTITVTNIADTPNTQLDVPLVDEVVIQKAVYNPVSSTLVVTANSFDRINQPILQAFVPGSEAPLGTFTNGQLIVSFPITIGSGQQSKHYDIPPEFVTVRSAAGGFDTKTVTVSVEDTAPVGTIIINNGAVSTTSTTVSVFLTAGSDNGAVTQMQFSKDGVNFFPFETFAPTRDLTLTDGPGTNTIYVRFKDANGVVSSIYSDSIILGTPPTGTIAINGGATFANVQAVTLTLSATDDSGIVESMQFSKDNISWTLFEPYATTRNVTLLPGEGFKAIYVRYRDADGNVSAPFSAFIMLDATAPTGTIVVNGGALITNSTAATVTLSATDANGIKDIRFSKDGGATWVTDWEAFTTTRNVNLLPNGSISVQYRDPAGNQSAVITDTIIVDTTPPIGTIQINGGSATTSSAAATLTLSATDANSVVSMQFSKDGGITWFALEPYSTTRNVVLTPPGAGVKTIDVRYKDAAGNLSDKLQATITML